MRQADLKSLIDGTLDAAYVVDSEGTVLEWNDGAAKLFGITAADAVGRPCYSLIQGRDESGGVCSQNCTIRQAFQQGRTLSSFDMQVHTAGGQKWCNATVFLVRIANRSAPYSIHVLRLADISKRLELAVRDYLVANTRLSAEEGTEMLASTTATNKVNLSVRELEVLQMLALGGSSKSIASVLHISGTTVSNHIQHILLKLDSHSRLEAIRRAERAGLV